MSYLLCDKCEAAFVSLLTAPLQAVDPTCQIVTSSEVTEKTLPLVGVAADGGTEEDPKGTGNYWIDVVVSLHMKGIQNENTTNPSDDADANALALISAVNSVIFVDDLDSQLSAAATGFTVLPQGIAFSAPTRDQQDDAWVSEIKLRIYCCASDLSP